MINFIVSVVNLYQKLFLLSKKNIFKHFGKVKIIKILYNILKISSVYLFRAALYEPILHLIEDDLFYFFLL